MLHCMTDHYINRYFHNQCTSHMFQKLRSAIFFYKLSWQIIIHFHNSTQQAAVALFGRTWCKVQYLSIPVFVPDTQEGRRIIRLTYLLSLKVSHGSSISRQVFNTLSPLTDWMIETEWFLLGLYRTYCRVFSQGRFHTHIVLLLPFLAA